MLREENFYDYAYKLFYQFSNVKPEQVGLEFSRQTTIPILKTIPDVSMVVPIPKRIGEEYALGGMLFENTDVGRKSMWALFFASFYHVASHAAISDYAKYVQWMKNKTEDASWQVIDFIEDIRAQEFLERTDKEIWRNVSEVESKLVPGLKSGNPSTDQSFQPYHKAQDAKILGRAKETILKAGSGDKDLLDIADYLYKRRNLLQTTILPNRERHVPTWPMKFELRATTLPITGEMADKVEKIDGLWMADEIEKTKILRQYKKHMKNLHFDRVVMPQGNLQKYSQTREKVLPLLRRMRQQIRLISNLTDSPTIDQVGYIDMQLAIQAIASESQTSDIFEREEIRRGEEAWVILVDKSASMNLRCQELNELLVCMAESANELTGKYDAWAVYGFDSSFHILKDFKERYSQEVKARIGEIGSGGLTLLPDALEVANRVLNEDQRERKYIFVITDGSPSGYMRIHEAFSKIVKKTDMSDITLVAIGVSKKVTRGFKNTAQAKDLKTLVAKFITAYRTASSDM